MTTTDMSMSASDFFDYLLERDQTRELAVQLAFLYEQRARTSGRMVGVR
jgi:hypothetical protein